MEKIEGIFGHQLGDVYHGPEVINVRPTEVLPFRKLTISTTMKSGRIYELMAHELRFKTSSLLRLRDALCEKYGSPSVSTWTCGAREIFVTIDSVTYFDNETWSIDRAEKTDTTHDVDEV